MKIILHEYVLENTKFVEITILNIDGSKFAVYTFDTMKQAEAFCTGFSCAKSLANSLVQSMPMGYTKV